MVWSPHPVQCYKPPPIVLQALLLSYLFIYLFIYVSISLSICVFMYVHIYRGPPWWLSGKEFACNAEDDSSVSGLRRSPGEENATHSSILALEIKGQRSLTNYSPWDHKESDTT